MSIDVVKHFSIRVLAKFLQETLFARVPRWGRKRRCKRDIPSPTFQFLNWVFHSPNSPSFEYDFPNEIEFHRRRNKKTSRRTAFYRIFSSRFPEKVFIASRLKLICFQFPFIRVFCRLIHNNFRDTLPAVEFVSSPYLSETFLSHSSMAQ